MTPRLAFLRRRGLGILAAVLVACAVAAVILLAGKTTEPLRERLFDAMIGGRVAAVSDRVWVIEIGAENEVGAQWSRADLARLITTLAVAKPSAIGLDIVLSQGCAPGADTDALVRAMAAVPVLTGFVVPGPEGNIPEPQLPIAVMQNAPAWNATGAETACPAFQAASAGAVLISLSGGRDGRIRTAPALGFVAGRPYAGLGVELARRAAGWPTAILGNGNPGWLRLGAVTIPLDAMGQFRFVPTPPERRANQTVAADAVLAGQLPVLPPNAVILIGSALPEKGGLRASRASPLHPSVHLQADVVEQLLSGHPFSRPKYAALIEAAVALIGGVLAVMMVVRLPRRWRGLLRGARRRRSGGLWRGLLRFGAISCLIRCCLPLQSSARPLRPCWPRHGPAKPPSATCHAVCASICRHRWWTGSAMALRRAAFWVSCARSRRCSPISKAFQI